MANISDKKFTWKTNDENYGDAFENKYMVYPYFRYGLK